MGLHKIDFETRFTGWAYIIAAALLWGSYTMSSHHIGEYIVAADFEAISNNVCIGFGCLESIFLAG